MLCLVFIMLMLVILKCAQTISLENEDKLLFYKWFQMEPFPQSDYCPKMGRFLVLVTVLFVQFCTLVEKSLFCTFYKYTRRARCMMNYEGEGNRLLQLSESRFKKQILASCWTKEKKKINDKCISELDFIHLLISKMLNTNLFFGIDENYNI